MAANLNRALFSVLFDDDLARFIGELELCDIAQAVRASVNPSCIILDQLLDAAASVAESVRNDVVHLLFFEFIEVGCTVETAVGNDYQFLHAIAAFELFENGKHGPEFVLISREQLIVNGDSVLVDQQPHDHLYLVDLVVFRKPDIAKRVRILAFKEIGCDVVKRDRDFALVGLGHLSIQICKQRLFVVLQKVQRTVEVLELEFLGAAENLTAFFPLGQL